MKSARAALKRPEAPYSAHGSCPRRRGSSRSRGKRILQIYVRDNNVDQALRVLKKRMQREGLFREMKRRRFYEKPSERAARERSEAIRRVRKLKRKQAQREGLLPLPKKKVPARAGVGRDSRAAPGR
jgi:small subunit ribosomal protein S21